MKARSLLAFALVLAAPAASGLLSRSSAAATALAQPRQSGPIALSGNGLVLVNVNPDANSVSVFKVADTGITLTRKIAVGREPVSIAVDDKGKKAWVANALDGTVSIVPLNKKRAKKGVRVGAEPRAVLLSPSGKLLYVANSASNEVVVLNSATLKRIARISLDAQGTAPRALAMTNDGDGLDTEETLYVALFYAQLRAGRTAVDEGQDDQREGRVAVISAATNTVTSVIALGPVSNAGFNSNGKLAPGNGLTPAVASTNPQAFTTPTGCFPNQLAAIALDPRTRRGYVVSTGASPNGPLRFNQNAQGLVSVFDPFLVKELVATQSDPAVRRTAPLNLNQGVNLATTPSPRLFHTNPVAMAWRPDGSDAWIVVQSSDVVVRLTIDDGGIPSIGAPLVAGPSVIARADLAPPTSPAAAVPRGIVINAAGTRAYVSNYVGRSVSVIDITNGTAPAVLATVESSPQPATATPEATTQLGASLFFTARGPSGRMSSESWGACAVCHPDGRSDNVTWMFDAGPRQTIPLDGTFARRDATDRRILNWSAVRDEVHDFELNTRNVFGGRGLITDDRLFLAIGGSSAGSDSTVVEQFEAFTGAVGTTNDLAAGADFPATLLLSPTRRDFGLATLDDGRVFLIGGRGGAGAGALVPAASAVVEFNPRTNVVTVKSGTGFTPRHSLGVAAVRTSAGLRIYAIGGYSSTVATSAPVATVEEYDPVADAWRPVASLPTAVAQFGITVAGGIATAEPLQLIHVVSGNAGTETVAVLNTANPVQQFQADPSGAGTWTGFSATGLTARRLGGAATALRGVQSRVFFIGGLDGTGTAVGTVEEYLAQAVTVVATTHTALPNVRARFGIASTLTSNQIYVVGGVNNGGNEQSSVFEYTAATNGAAAGPAGTPSGAWVTRANLGSVRSNLQLSSPPPVVNFLPVKSAGRDASQDAIAAWVAAKVRAASAPVPADIAAVKRGRALFAQDGLVVSAFSCVTCHGGPKWTRSRVDYAAPPSPEITLGFGSERVIGAELRQTQTQSNTVLANVGTFAPNSAGGRVNEIRANAADVGQAIAPLGANGFNIPSLSSVHETAPYFYSGLAQTLEQVFDGSQDGSGGIRHHFVADTAKRADLIAFLRTIDDTTPTFP